MHFLKDRGLPRDPPSQITPQRVYQQRRQLLQGVAGTVALAGLGAFKPAHAQVARAGKLAALSAARSAVPGADPGPVKTVSLRSGASCFSFAISEARSSVVTTAVHRAS